MRNRKRFIIMIFVVLVFFFAIGCDKQEEAKPMDDNTGKKVTEEVKSMALPEHIGDMVKENVVENIEGNYQIPIPDEWMGRVSAKLNGTQTILYHLTQDKNAMEMYPELLNIDIAKNADMINGEVFMEIGGISYFSVPRFDFPYEESSIDGAEFAAFFESIPMVLQSFWLIDDTAWKEEMPSDTIAGTKPFGTVVDNNTLNVKSGFYSVTVPNNWIRKTSYKTSGNMITFYHITIDPSEMEISPEIMTIDVADGLLLSGPEETYSSGGYTFYYTPRFDFPYESGDSPDGKEFAMISNGMQSVLLSCKLNQSENKISAKPFTKEDAQFDGVYIGDKKTDVLARMGPPISAEQVTYEATGDMFDILTYDFGELHFSGNQLMNAMIKKSGITGPRGLSIGAKLDDVVMMFASDAERVTDNTTIFYRRNTSSESYVHVPPYGVLYDGDTKTLAFACFADEDDVKGMSIEQLERDSYFIYQYYCTFSFDKDERVDGISIGLGAPSE